MNPHSSTIGPARSRLVCRVVRQWAALSDARHSRHVTACADCREYFAAIQNLETGLRDHAALISTRPSADDFAQQIVHAVRAEVSQRQPVASASHRRVRGFSALAAAAGVAFVLTLSFRTPPAGHTVTPPSTGEEAQVIVSAVQSLSRGLVETVIPSAGELVATNPLQEELSLVYSDVRSALDFVALNFLPSSTAAVASQPASRI